MTCQLHIVYCIIKMAKRKYKTTKDASPAWGLPVSAYAPLSCCHCQRGKVKKVKKYKKSRSVPYASKVGKSPAEIKLAALKLLKKAASVPANENLSAFDQQQLAEEEAEIDRFRHIQADVDMTMRGKRRRGEDYQGDFDDV